MTSAVHGIVAGYDGSPGSETALMWATREARDRGSVLTVCYAWALGYLPPAGESAALDLARRSGERTLDRGLRYAQAVLGSSAARPLLAEGRPPGCCAKAAPPPRWW
jgi:nucleotide-binding universal stress UspA family protein